MRLPRSPRVSPAPQPGSESAGDGMWLVVLLGNLLVVDVALLVALLLLYRY